MIVLKVWQSVEELHNHAKQAIGRQIKNLVKPETTQKYYDSPKNKGWIGNSVESDYFGLPNNSRKEADFANLGVELKVTPIKMTKKGWSSKERLTLNVFDFHDECTRTFETASFIQKANLIEIVYYEFIQNIPSPDLIIKRAVLFDLLKLPEEDMLIIKQDWEKIVRKINDGKAEELSDSLTTYLGATTKGSKSERNMRSQPYSNKKAHQRAFTLKTTYMSFMAKKFMSEDFKEESLISDVLALKEKTFEEIITEKFRPFIGKKKSEIANQFGVVIPKQNDKASSHTLANKMLNLKNDIQDTKEFQKGNISVKIVTVNRKSKTKGSKLPKATEGFKLQNYFNFSEIIQQDWEDSQLYEYLSETRFLLVIWEETKTGEIFRGVKFWNMPFEDLEGQVHEVWEKTRQTLIDGVELEYKPSNNKKGFIVCNNFTSMSDEKILHVRPDAAKSSYKEDLNTMRLPNKSKLKNRPLYLEEELTDDYMTKQAFWLNPTYMYQQVKELFK
ncbi:hypothetical protein CN453_04750 [Bacillus cereus]|nr:hypothetical protein CN453_04750 [Bacillus cereus]